MRQGFINVALAILLGALIVGIVGTGAYLGLNKPAPVEPPIVGATGVVQAQAFFLSGSGVTASQTTLPLTSFKLPDASTTITMANFSNAIGYGTIEPGSTKEEQISFTGVTQNADGTASLTGVTRGVNFVSPFNSVTSYQKAHAGGVKFVLSNTAAFYSQFPSTNSTATISSVWTFSSTSIPQQDNYLAPTTNNQFAPKGYVDAVSFAGAPPASQSVAGIGIFSSLAQLQAGTATSTYNASTYYLFPQNSYFNATSTATTTVPVTQTNGKLSQGFLDLTQGWTFSGGVTSTGAFVQSATTTFSGPTTTFSGYVSFASTTAFATYPTMPSSSPVNANDGVRKLYVDQRTTGWVTTATSSVLTNGISTSSAVGGLIVGSVLCGGGACNITGYIGATTSSLAVSAVSLTNGQQGAFVVPVPAGWFYRVISGGTVSAVEADFFKFGY